MSEFVEGLTDVINTVADKVKEYGGYAKLQALIKAEEAMKQDYYYRLGKKYYELYKDAPASDLTEITDKLVAADAKIAEYQEELKAAQAAGYTDVSDVEEAEVEDVDAPSSDDTVADEDATEETNTEE